MASATRLKLAAGNSKDKTSFLCIIFSRKRLSRWGIEIWITLLSYPHSNTVIVATKSYNIFAIRWAKRPARFGTPPIEAVMIDQAGKAVQLTDKSHLNSESTIIKIHLSCGSLCSTV